MDKEKVKARINDAIERTKLSRSQLAELMHLPLGFGSASSATNYINNARGGYFSLIGLVQRDYRTRDFNLRRFATFLYILNVDAVDPVIDIVRHDHPDFTYPPEARGKAKPQPLAAELAELPLEAKIGELMPQHRQLLERAVTALLMSPAYTGTVGHAQQPSHLQDKT